MKSPPYDPASTPWQQALKQAYRQPIELLNALELTPQDICLSDAAAQQFSMRVPRHFAQLIQPKNPHDPLLKQVLPTLYEGMIRHDDLLDPLQELRTNPIPGLLHKYHARVLITLTGSCAIHCRFCFRRHFPYNQHTSHQYWPQHMAYIQADPTISEVILSGGDPLLLSDDKLATLFNHLNNIPHLTRVRLHTRIPIVLPERMTDSLLNLLSSSRLDCVMVTHSNHANELSTYVKHVLLPYRQAGITLLNQAVLLKDVNDNLPALCDLHEQLFTSGILPYYLHTLDPVAGASHFAIGLNEAQQLHQGMINHLPGYLVPKLVKEIPGKSAKTWLNTPT